MKNYFILACLLIVVTSCGTEKKAIPPGIDNATETKMDNEAPDEIEPGNSHNGNVLTAYGKIRDKSEDGCGFVIQVMVAANTESSTHYEPLTLPEEYQEEGKFIRIEYRMSRRPSNCTIAIPIIIDKVLSK